MDGVPAGLFLGGRRCSTRYTVGGGAGTGFVLPGFLPLASGGERRLGNTFGRFPFLANCRGAGGSTRTPRPHRWRAKNARRAKSGVGPHHNRIAKELLSEGALHHAPTYRQACRMASPVFGPQPQIPNPKFQIPCTLPPGEHNRVVASLVFPANRRFSPKRADALGLKTRRNVPLYTKMRR